PLSCSWLPPCPSAVPPSPPYRRMRPRGAWPTPAMATRRSTRRPRRPPSAPRASRNTRRPLRPASGPRAAGGSPRSARRARGLRRLRCSSRWRRSSSSIRRPGMGPAPPAAGLGRGPRAAAAGRGPRAAAAGGRRTSAGAAAGPRRPARGGPEASFRWLAEYALSDGALPPPWEAHTDPASGRVFYVEPGGEESSWEHPLAPQLRRIVEIGREILENPREGLLEEAKAALWHEQKDRELNCWHGPYQRNSGDGQYFVNSTTGASSPFDPRERAQFAYESQTNLLDHMQKVLTEQDVHAASPRFGSPRFGQPRAPAASGSTRPGSSGGRPTSACSFAVSFASPRGSTAASRASGLHAASFDGTPALPVFGSPATPELQPPATSSTSCSATGSSASKRRAAANRAARAATQAPQGERTDALSSMRAKAVHLFTVCLEEEDPRVQRLQLARKQAARQARLAQRPAPLRPAAPQPAAP
ncbi:unnamed protein product, partial [Prorocentrum cordatum]